MNQRYLYDPPKQMSTDDKIMPQRILQRLTEAYGPPARAEHTAMWSFKRDEDLAPLSLTIEILDDLPMRGWVFNPKAEEERVQGVRLSNADDVESLMSMIQELRTVK